MSDLPENQEPNGPEGSHVTAPEPQEPRNTDIGGDANQRDPSWRPGDDPSQANQGDTGEVAGPDADPRPDRTGIEQDAHDVEER